MLSMQVTQSPGFFRENDSAGSLFPPSTPALTPAVTFLLLWTFRCYSLSRRSWENLLENLISVFSECPHFIFLECSFSVDWSSTVQRHSDFPRTYISLSRIILALRMEVIREREYTYELNLKVWNIVWLKSCVETWILWLNHWISVQFKRTSGLKFS